MTHQRLFTNDSNMRSQDMVISIPVQGAFERKVEQAMKQGAAIALMCRISKENQRRVRREKFERWKFSYLAVKQGVKILH